MTPAEYRAEVLANKEQKERCQRRTKLREALVVRSSWLSGTSADALAHGMTVPSEEGSDPSPIVVESDEDSAAAGAQERALRDGENVASDCAGVSMLQRWKDDF